MILNQSLFNNRIFLLIATHASKIDYYLLKLNIISQPFNRNFIAKTVDEIFKLLKEKKGFKIFISKVLQEHKNHFLYNGNKKELYLIIGIIQQAKYCKHLVK